MAVQKTISVRRPEWSLPGAYHRVDSFTVRNKVEVTYEVNVYESRQQAQNRGEVYDSATFRFFLDSPADSGITRACYEHYKSTPKGAGGDDVIEEGQR